MTLKEKPKLSHQKSMMIHTCQNCGNLTSKILITDAEFLTSEKSCCYNCYSDIQKKYIKLLEFMNEIIELNGAIVLPEIAKDLLREIGELKE